MRRRLVKMKLISLNFEQESAPFVYSCIISSLDILKNSRKVELRYAKNVLQ